jgi:rod shape-determining protein MreD
VRLAVHAAVAVLLLALQAALLRHLGGGMVSVCLLAPLLVHLALSAGSVEGALGAAVLGALLDVAAGTPGGLLTGLAVAAFLAARLVGAAVDVRGRLGFAALSGAAALLLSAGAVALQRLGAAPEIRPGWALLPRLLLEAAVTGLCAPLVLRLLNRLDAWLGEEEPGLIR